MSVVTVLERYCDLLKRKGIELREPFEGERGEVIDLVHGCIDRDVGGFKDGIGGKVYSDSVLGVLKSLYTPEGIDLDSTILADSREGMQYVMSYREGTYVDSGGVGHHGVEGKMMYGKSGVSGRIALHGLLSKINDIRDGGVFFGKVLLPAKRFIERVGGLVEGGEMATEKGESFPVLRFAFCPEMGICSGKYVA
jgi:hypothetical protein